MASSQFGKLKMVFVYPILLLKFFSSNRVFQKRVYLLVPTLQFLYAKILFMSYYMNCQIQRFLKFLYTAVHAILLFYVSVVITWTAKHRNCKIQNSSDLEENLQIYFAIFSLSLCHIISTPPPPPFHFKLIYLTFTSEQVCMYIARCIKGCWAVRVLPKLLKEGGFLRGNRICMKNVLLLRTQKIKAFRQKLKYKQ